MRLLLVVDAVWIAGLAVVGLAIRRETEILRRRFESDAGTVRDGPFPGSMAPRVNGKRLRSDTTLLFVSADCPPCFNLLDQLGDAVDSQVEIVMKEADEPLLGDELARLGRRAAAVHRGVAGAAIRSAMWVRSEPLAVRISGGVVVRKGYVRDQHDLAVVSGRHAGLSS